MNTKKENLIATVKIIATVLFCKPYTEWMWGFESKNVEKGQIIKTSYVRWFRKESGAFYIVSLKKATFEKQKHTHISK